MGRNPISEYYEKPAFVWEGIGMAKGQRQKLKLLYLKDILLEETDETKGLTLDEIIEKLENRGVSAERKSLYDDFEQLRLYGVDVEMYRDGRKAYYHVVSGQFELAELKLLVDAVQSSKFITAKKSDQLIKKIESLTSKRQAKMLTRQVYVQHRVKTMNETIYYNVDEIHLAMNDNKQIRFQYFQWGIHKKMILKRDGAFYEISPWGLSWDDENYYMLGFDEEAGILKHFRVDKMIKVQVAEKERKGRKIYQSLDMADFARKHFGMFSGKEETVRIRFKNYLAGVVIDRFGKDVTLIKDGEEHFTARVTVAVSDQFLGWLIAFHGEAKVLSPDWVSQRMRELAEQVLENQ